MGTDTSQEQTSRLLYAYRSRPSLESQECLHVRPHLDVVAEFQFQFFIAHACNRALNSHLEGAPTVIKTWDRLTQSVESPLFIWIES